MNSNNIAKNRTQLVRRTALMTYLAGIKCKDGVLLAADTKFTTNDGTDDNYGDKITGEINGVFTGFAGSREPFTEFRIRLREYVGRNGSLVSGGDRINIMIGDVMKSMVGKYYNNSGYSLLAGISGVHYADKKSVLTYFYGEGRPELSRTF